MLLFNATMYVSCWSTVNASSSSKFHSPTIHYYLLDWFFLGAFRNFEIRIPCFLDCFRFSSCDFYDSIFDRLLRWYGVTLEGLFLCCLRFCESRRNLRLSHGSRISQSWWLNAPITKTRNTFLLLSRLLLNNNANWYWFCLLFTGI